MLKKLTALMTALLLIVSLCACTKEKEEGDALKIAVTIAPQKEWVEKIGGDLVEVNVMVPPGSDPESYEPTMRQIADFSDAVLYFAIGVPAEQNGILDAASDETLVIDLAAESAKVYRDLTIGEERDPHIWLSVKRVTIMIKAIEEALCRVDEGNADTYRANAASYIEELQGCDAMARETLAGLKKRDIMVFHPAFGYFFDEYDLKMHALEEEGKEATLRDLTAKIELAKEKGIQTVFYQAETSSKQAETVAAELGGTAVCLAPLAENYAENICRMALLIRQAEGESADE